MQPSFRNNILFWESLAHLTFRCHGDICCGISVLPATVTSSQLFRDIPFQSIAEMRWHCPKIDQKLCFTVNQWNYFHSKNVSSLFYPPTSALYCLTRPLDRNSLLSLFDKWLHYVLNTFTESDKGQSGGFSRKSSRTAVVDMEDVPCSVVDERGMLPACHSVDKLIGKRLLHSAQNNNNKRLKKRCPKNR